jgi:hypothetical protein
MCAETHVGLHLTRLLLLSDFNRNCMCVSKQSYKQEPIKPTLLLHRFILLQIFYFYFYYYYYYYYYYY